MRIGKYVLAGLTWAMIWPAVIVFLMCFGIGLTIWYIGFAFQWVIRVIVQSMLDYGSYDLGLSYFAGIHSTQQQEEL